MGNPIVHFELNVPGPKALGDFYTSLFGWSANYSDELNYALIDTGAGAGINGGIGLAEANPAGATFYIETPDLQASLDKITSLGGKAIVPPTEIPNIVTFALFSDPEGNIVGLVKEEQGDQPGVSQGSNPPVAWFEVLGKDASSLQKFYVDAFAWSIKAGGSDPGYGEVDTGTGRGIPGGIGESPVGEPGIVLYAQVDELAKYLDKAAELGAKTVLEPMKVSQGTSIAQFIDPQGNRFGLFVSEG